MKVFLVIKGLMMVTGVAIYLFAEPCGCDGGVVIDKVHVPSHREEVDWYSVHLDAPMIRQVNHPEQFWLMMESDGQTCSCEVSEATYSAVEVDDYYQGL